MKNPVNTERLEFRFPKSLVDEIDRCFELRMYANRPDFIISAIRYYQKRIYDMIEDQEDCSLDFDEEIKTTPAKERRVKKQMDDMEKMFVAHERVYKGYKGEPIRVIVRIPRGYRETWNVLQILKLPIKSYQDFTRLAVASYINECLTDGLFDIEYHVRRLRARLKGSSSLFDEN